VTVARYAGVLAFHGRRVVLVREEYPTWGGEFWNLPSGRVEDDESPAEGAARELAEETGLVVAPADLLLVSTTVTAHGDRESRAWNHVVEVAATELCVADPDGIVREARWFDVADAVEVLAILPYRPLAEPAVAYLTGRAEPGREWHFVL
jgi:ADP-ribose pyrophosphatase YjhB (NUDIX family)